MVVVEERLVNSMQLWLKTVLQSWNRRARSLAIVLAMLSIAPLLYGPRTTSAAEPTPVTQPVVPNIQPSGAPVAPGTEHGHELVAKWCTLCHSEPDPGDLPRERWHFQVGWMGNYLGFPNITKENTKIVYRSLVASQPAITRDELDAIEKYLTTNAKPENRPAFNRDSPPPVTTLFRPEGWPGYGSPITVSMLKIDEKYDRVYVGTAENSLLAIFTSGGEFLDKVGCNQNQAIKVRVGDEGFDLVLIGAIGIDLQQATVHKILGFGKKPGALRAQRIIEGFHRTSGADWGDLDGDGKEDVVMAGFGDEMNGSLAWFTITPNEPAERHDLRLGSGALDAVIDDVDHDGDLDILSIVAQGNQEVWWFENDGHATFYPRMLWKERPSTGYNAFQWGDFNGDGKKDIIAVAGNNMEMIDPPIKPLHGIYVFLQTEPMKFTKTLFLRMDGPTKALARDFDNDGDLDIAAISAYPDWRAKQPVTFTLFTNDGNGKFTPSTIPDYVSGQYITMDAGDIDKDGDIDLILGTAGWRPNLREPLLSKVTKSLDTMPAVVVLRNQLLPRIPAAQ